MSDPQDTAARAARRVEMEAVLADYPHLSEERLAALLVWFRKEASALDVATMASNPAVADRYRSFRADHIDRVTAGEWMKGLLIAGAVGAAILLVIWGVF